MLQLLEKKITSSLAPYNFKADELAIINALLLGQRQDISDEIYNSYTGAGAIHILAISGLHVGIILLMLNFIAKPLDYFKIGRIIKPFILIVLLWGFAVIAGLSASVVRAVTMFSFLTFALVSKRSKDTYNLLFTSIFFLLLVKPTFLFDVGFQLSYAAVFGIIWGQPTIYNWWKIKRKIPDKIWQLFTVTVSAQFGILPLSLFYFHKFPSLLVLSNLVIIPFLGYILGFGIFIIILSLLNLSVPFLAKTYGFVIGLMNDFVKWISKQEDFFTHRYLF